MLVIEDEVLVGMDVVAMLEGAGFGEVLHAMTESEALDRLRSERWDAVVADANLNGQSIHYIVAVLHQRDLPFVVVSGYGRQQLPSSIGEAPVLAKPVSTYELIRCVQQLCRCAPHALAASGGA